LARADASRPAAAIQGGSSRQIAGSSPRRYVGGMRALATLFLLIAACGHASSAPPAASVPPVTPSPQLAPAMAKLGFMRGVWRGEASGTLPDGKRYRVTQTERMGPMLGGDIVVIEGRGYKDDGSTGFNAFAVVSWNPHAEKYEIRSYAQGQAGTFDLTLTPTGYVWQVPAGPEAIVRFTATVSGDRWREVGEYVVAGKPPVPTFEMNLQKVGDTDWPLARPVTPR
jgi:hypothetical protein